jgi:hypothetical protein
VTDNDDEHLIELPPLPTRAEIRRLAANLGTREVRYLVDLYYELQGYRLSTANQRRALTKSGEPQVAISWALNATEHIEETAKSCLTAYALNDELCVWAMGVVGIGPVIASGLRAHLDITTAPTVGHWWSFGGYNPDMVWKEGEKRPYNPRLKVLYWRIGKSFVLFKNHKNSYYGPLYDQRKAFEIAKNERGDNKEAAAKRLKQWKIKDAGLKKLLQEGKLPPSALDARARRWTVKLFIAHYHDEAWRQHFHTEPPLPYPIAYLGHAHKIEKPPAA